MGFVFTLIFVAVTIVSPEQLGSWWAAYRPEFWIALLTLVCSLPSLRTNLHCLRSVQSYLLLCFIVVIAISQIANGWVGGAIESLEIFLPSVAVFFFIVLNVTTLRKLKILTFVFVASCLTLVAEGLSAYYFGFLSDIFLLHQHLYVNDEITGELLRLRAAGFLNDPNDFAQILIVALPLIFVAWERGRTARNLFMVLLPAAALIWAIFLTHSRGALIGLAVIALFAVRKRLGTTGSSILTGLLVLSLLAVNFSGGRGISASEGADRLEAWATGLELFKGSPLFGIGFNGFTDYSEITAHNSFVLCLAELGLAGSLIWVAILVRTFLGLNRIITSQAPATHEGTDKVEDGEEPSVPPMMDTCEFAMDRAGGGVASLPEVNTEEFTPSLQDTDTFTPRRWALNVRLALIGFLTTGWFLSRSYKATLFLTIGIASALIALAPEDADPSQKWRWVRMSLAVEVAAIVLIYFLVRFRH